MSAYNWAICPKCKIVEDEKWTQKLHECAKAYGKVPAEEYQRMTDALRNPPELEHALREDYELGIDAEGEFNVRYSGYCQTCGLTHRFKHSEPVNLDQVNTATGRKNSQ